MKTRYIASEINSMANPGKTLTHKEFEQILTEIANNHPWHVHRGVKNRGIKYIIPSYDMRDYAIFHLYVYGVCGKQEFDYRDSSEPMLERVMRWLKEGEQ